jgi:hypothetical protein
MTETAAAVRVWGRAPAIQTAGPCFFSVTNLVQACLLRDSGVLSD